jgi:tetratricopeptide (TPR) repeat protein
MKTRLLLAAGLLAAALGCSKDPDVEAREYIASGDTYMTQQKLDAAIIEYRNAVRVKPETAEAHYKLARAYESQGDPVNAYGAYARTADLDPSNTDAQLKAGSLLLAAGEYDAARRRAEFALQAHPQDPAVHILLGNALAGLNETGRAIRQMEQAIALDPASAPAWSALGSAQFAGGSRAKAGEAFLKAVTLAPGSIDARLALANYQWAAGSHDEAERTLKEALALDPGAPSVHRALALFYLVTRRAAEAEPHFTALARHPGGALALADYYAGTGRSAQASAVLQPVAGDANHPDAAAARLRLASIDYAAGRKEEAYASVDGLLGAKPSYAEAHIAKARMLLLDGGDLQAAETHARQALAAASTLPSAHYTAGLVALERRDIGAAEQAFRDVLKLNPSAGAAQLQLARIQLARGDTAGALSAAEQAARQRPDDPMAAVLVSRSLRAQGNLARAERELSAVLARSPGAAALHVERGELALQQGLTAAARAAFENALRLEPSMHEARVGLISVDVADKDLAGATARLSAWRASAPGDRALQVLAARVDLLAGRTAEAERALREVVTADASQLDAYDLLGRLYLAQNQADRAISEYRALAARAKVPAGALTMVGLIHEATGDRDAARTQYEQILADHPRAGVAANNLAWIYAETGRADAAVKLALVARDELRGRPEAEDTLGWAYYHKGLVNQSIAAFERAVTRAPGRPLYHYHLGLAHAKEGSEDRARQAFEKALALKVDFPGADDARERLRGLDR